MHKKRQSDMPIQTIIDIQNLTVGFTDKNGFERPVLRNIDLQIQRGETVGLVGESGSGKSTLALAAMGYLKTGLRVFGGSAQFCETDMFKLARTPLQALRGGKIALIPQNSGQSLTPTMRIGAQMSEALELHSSLPQSAHVQRSLELLTRVRLPDPHAILTRYPHELSGGQQQRVALAMALTGEPLALLLDEPTTGLDVTTQAHILELLREINEQTGTAMVYVSHDLGAIARVCERVVVLYAGEVVSDGITRTVLRSPSHPYAHGLLASIPRLADARMPIALDGRPPAPGEAGPACAFAPRCVLASERCQLERPPLRRLVNGEQVRCHFPEQTSSIDCADSRVARVAKQSQVRPLKLDRLGVSYARPSLVDQLLGREPNSSLTVQDVNLRIGAGETLALVGESGSGKSTILKAVAGLLAPACGSISFADESALGAQVEQRSQSHLRKIQLIFQNPDDSLNPRHTVATILAQPLELYFKLTRAEVVERSISLLERVRLGAHYMDRLPSQMSGGEKQRVAIARAFAAEPDVVLCDEVTSALDVSVQAAVLDLLDELRAERGTSYLFVSHDLAVVRAIAHRVAVLYQGRLCEIGPSAAIYSQPLHPYTQVLLGAVLEPDPDHAPRLLANDVVESEPPKSGCPFQRRCPVHQGAACDRELPPWQHVDENHHIRCHIPLANLMQTLSAGKKSMHA